MKQDKQGKQPQLNSLILYGSLMIFFSFLYPAKGPLTGALNIFCSVGGLALCTAGVVQENKKSKK